MWGVGKYEQGKEQIINELNKKKGVKILTKTLMSNASYIFTPLNRGDQPKHYYKNT